MGRFAWVVAVLVAACGGNDVDPRVIGGGGVGDGDIDGEVNVYVIDANTDAVIAGAHVQVGSKEGVTDATGLFTVKDVTGKQTITATADGHRGSMWVGANGANITIPLTPTSPTTVPSATLSGTITGYDTISVPANHVKFGAVLYSQTDELGAPENSLPQTGNTCLSQDTCGWVVSARVGTVSLIAVVLDRDTKGTLDGNDDTTSVIGWAYKTGIHTEAGVAQSGLDLALVQTGDLQQVTIDTGTPPAGLPTVQAIPGIDISDDEIVQLPIFLLSDPTSALMPKPSVFGGSTYRLTVIAQTDAGDHAAQSIALRHDLAGPTLAVDKWLVPPTGVAATRTDGSFAHAEGAQAYNFTWERGDTGEDLFEATIFDGTTSITVPSSVTFPAGALRARAGAIGATFDFNDFSLDDDQDKLTAIATQPVEIP